MRRLPSAIALAAITAFAAPAFAHHSQAMFDTSKEILVEGKVARFDWVNPHMYLIVETKGPDGKPALVEGEGLAITQALVDVLDREALKPGTPVVMRANPNRGGWGKQVRILDVTTEDGEIHPFYAGNTRTRTLTPAESLAAHWAPSRAALGAGFGAMARWPVTPEGRAAQAKLVADGLCYVEPVPFIAVLDELRTIEIGEDEVVIRFDNTGDRVDRTIHMTAAHPANVQPSFHGHSIGRWDGDTLVVDVKLFTDKTWFDKAGNFHRGELHVIEGFTRTGPDHRAPLPPRRRRRTRGALSRVWTAKRAVRPRRSLWRVQRRRCGPRRAAPARSRGPYCGSIALPKIIPKSNRTIKGKASVKKRATGSRPNSLNCIQVNLK